MKKKIAILLSCTLLVTGLVGCGSKDTSSANTSTETSTEQSTDGATRVFQLGHLDPSQDDNAYQI